jgi:outer membrane protein
MKHFRGIFLVAAMIGSLTIQIRIATAQIPDSLSLPDVVQRAVQNSPAVQRAVENARAAAARVGQNRSALYPTAAGEADYSRIGPVPSIPFGNEVFLLAPANNYDLHVNGMYTVYDFGRNETQVKLSESRAIQSGDAVDVARMSLAYQATYAYYGILFLEQSITVQDQQIAALNEHRTVAQKRVQTGAGIALDVMTTDVRVASAQSQRVDLVSMLDKQKTILRELLGLPASAPVKFKGDLALAPVSLNEDSLAAAAFEQRIDMRLARDEENSAKIQAKLANLNELPSLNVMAEGGFKNGYETNLDKWVANFVAGARLSVPLYTGKRKDYQKQEAAANLRAQQENIQALERQIRGETNRAVVDVQSALDKLQITQVAIERANEAVKVARSAYAYGTLTNVELLDAETAVALADLSRVQALYNFELARSALEQATGVRIWETP